MSKKLEKHDLDNHSNQLNPLHEAYLLSRKQHLTQKDVAAIQKAEFQNKKRQTKDGLGAQAQRIFAMQNVEITVTN